MTRAGGSSLRWRVAASSALVAAVIGLVSAGSASFLLERLSRAAEDRRLQDSATVLAAELDEPGTDIVQATQFEAREDEPLGIRVGVVRAGQLLAGAPIVPLVSGPGCFDAEGVLRVCAVASHDRLVFAAATDPGQHDRRLLLLAIVGLVSALAALLGAFASNLLAGWALSPLTDLGRAIAGVSTGHPKQADLGKPSGSSEVDALRATILELLDRLGTSLDHARSFGANAAHELRSPLAAMMMEIDLLREKAESEELVRVRKNIERLSIMVDRLLSMSDAPTRPVEEVAVALEDVVQDVVSGRRPQERKRIQFGSGPSGMVRGDEALLRVAVDNLVDNALKFSVGAVSIAITEEAAEVVVTVEDDGEGVSEEDGERFMRPFVRGSSTVGGHGLGLAITAHAVRLHGGAIRFTRLSGRGREGRPGGAVSLRMPAWQATTGH